MLISCSQIVEAQTQFETWIIQRTNSSGYFFEDEFIPVRIDVKSRIDETSIIFVTVNDTLIENPIITNSELEYFNLTGGGEGSWEITRKLPEGNWKTTVQIRVDSLESVPIASSITEVSVKPIETRAAIAAAEAGTKSAEFAEINAWSSPIVAGAAAIVGGLSGAFFTSHFGIKSEREKHKILVRNVRTLVTNELQEYSHFLTLLENEPEAESGQIVTSDELAGAAFNMLPFKPKYYPTMSIETKANVFDKESLNALEGAYATLLAFDRPENVTRVLGGMIFSSDAVGKCKKSVDHAITLLK